MRKLTNIKRVFIAIVFLLGVSCSSEKLVYVSTQGNDSDDGTLEHPYLTIEKARDVIRKKKQSGENGTYTILLREGNYYFTQTLELGDQDKKLKIAPYKNEKVLFFGGISIDPGKIIPISGSDKEQIFPVKNRGHISMVKLRELGLTNYGELKQVGYGHLIEPSCMEIFINSVAGHLSRWPNDSVVAIDNVIEKGSVAAEGDKGNIGGKFYYPGNRPSGWKASDNIWIFGYFHYGWADDVVKLASIDTLKKTFTTLQPHIYGYCSGKSWNAWYAYNIPEEIDTPGEYYIDRNEGILYFYNPGGINTLEVSILERPFISMTKTSAITIKGVDFRCSRGIGVDIQQSSQCLLKNCTFQNLGLYAVNISDGDESVVGKNNGLTNCTIFQTGMGGIRMSGGNRKTLKAAGNFVENCSIHDFNRIIKTYCAGVQISGVGNRIAHCEIYNAPHCAILLSGNDHLIEYNNIHDVCQVTDDVGALYYGRNPSMRGLLVRYNYFHHINDTHRCSAVYHDDGACGMEVTGNVFYKAGSMPVLIGGGSDNPYTNNIFIDCPIAIHIDDRLQSGYSENLWIQPGNLFEQELNEVKYNQPTYSTKYPELAKYWDEKPGFPKRNVVDKNVFVRIDKVIKGDKSWLEYSDNNYITTEDPGFENEKEQDFKLKESSEVFKKVPGFQPIPFGNIGIIESGKSRY